MALDPHPRRNNDSPSDLIVAMFQRIGIDPTIKEHRDEWVKFVLWAWEEFGDAIKQQQARETRRAARVGRIWALATSVAVAIISVLLSYYFSRR